MKIIYKILIGLIITISIIIIGFFVLVGSVFGSDDMCGNEIIQTDYSPNKEYKIVFYNDIKNNFETTTHNQNIYNSKSFTIVPQQNELILFFSNLRHEIKTNLSDKDRYSLAFNCLPSGNFGKGDSYSEFI